MHDGGLILTLMYRCETIVRIGKDRYKIRAAEVDNLCSIVEIRRIGRIKNEDARSIFGVKNLLERCTDKTLKILSHKIYGTVDNRFVMKTYSFKVSLKMMMS